MRRAVVLGIGLATVLARISLEKSETEEAMDMYVAADGARVAAWLVRKFKAQLRKAGAFDLHIEARLETPPYVRVALEKLKRSGRWDVTKKTLRGQRTYRVRWLAWRQNTPEARAVGWS